MTRWPNQHKRSSLRRLLRENGRCRPCAAISLVEILVALAIIAALCGILFPLLRSAKASAKDSGHAYQLHQIGLSWEIYSQDSNNTVPTIYKLNSSGTVDKQLFASSCDPNPHGWTNILGDAGHDPSYEGKVSTIDLAFYMGQFGLNDDYVRTVAEKSKHKGWVFLPGCTAELRFQPTRSPWHNSPGFLGKYSLLRFDTSVENRTSTLSTTLDGSLFCYDTYFSDEPCKLPPLAP